MNNLPPDQNQSRQTDFSELAHDHLHDALVEGVRKGHIVAVFAGKSLSYDEVIRLHPDLHDAVHFMLTGSGSEHAESAIAKLQHLTSTDR